MEINFKKKFGQNFLTDNNLLTSIVSDSKINSDTIVVEIGAGAGALTQKLCEKAKHVYVFEIDTELKDVLSDNLSGYNNYTLIFKDFLKVESQELADIVGDEFCVVANLPYYITSPLISKFLDSNLKVKSLTIMVQEEVAYRICATPKNKDYGVLTVMVALRGTAKIVRKVNRKMFTPAPNVDSAIVHIDISRNQPDYKQIVDFTKQIYSNRRKTIVNNLGSKPKQLVLDALAACNIGASARAEELTYEQIVELYYLINK